jgi:transcription antitermination protein NusB
MKTKTDSRHNSRRLALASIFCWLFSDTETDQCMGLAKSMLKCEKADLSLTENIVDGVKEKRSEIDALITRSAPEWPLDKISKVDLVILRIAIYEILFGKGIPEKVAIDEGIELAKEFGNDASSKFVNGVLGTVVESSNKQEVK